ncbi:MAG: ribosome silencing factor [Anaerolineae bacterium]|nr:ribosome silencing factor [Caldilineales bacterium]MCX7852698.1 ribosome silencing factor [Caldilineales bacterium]MDW8268764.1 ribosome silencing factor [Anaerolineae bacterium]
MRLPLKPQELARTIVHVLDDKLAEDILLLDVSTLSPLTDYFVIATATSERQSQALVDALLEALRAQEVRPLFIEGERDSGWQLLDYGDVIVHIFSPEKRAYYRLEELWKRAQVVVRVQ